MQNRSSAPSHSSGRSSANLVRLEDMDDFRVADGSPDIRGWSVLTADGQRAGRVESLIVDLSAMQVRFLDVHLDRDSMHLQEERHVLVPIEQAQLDKGSDDVHLEGMSASQLVTLRAYQPGAEIDSGSSLGRDSASAADQAERHLTLSEEEMRIGKRQTQAGEVEVRKTVETEHLSTQVPVSHEEVSIERRAIQPGSGQTGTISEDEIRIPLMGEEAVVEKRVVPREEVVISKKTVHGEQTVDAELKRERLDVNETNRSRR